MHELGITQNILDSALAEAEGAGAREVRQINLVIGELSGVSEESVRFHFATLSRGTIAERAELAFTVAPAKSQCRRCDSVFEAEKHDWACPECGGSDLEVTGGRELRVESIEVD